ncbi:repressor LexA [Leptolyngbya sp. FACHB-541]|uniref:transcriptional repressor LexA n=1 Tax=Leptolyngbya sp. FACHB-541 TaxID=2692810 RepID=UPI001682A12D|nr:transcriptional repressor LexA [Leptolyngbya sp. FACHB-541]MBD1995243.1 repressor LexA [Leptolyngbya sp. FACHB-541]
MQALTRVQQQLYDWLVSYFEQNQCPPTIREMQEAMGLKSPAPIQSRLDALELKGYIERSSYGRSRNIRLVQERMPAPKGIPIMGAIAAGGLVETFADGEVEYVPEAFLAAKTSSHEMSKHFAVRVRGDSMIDASITSGDVVFLKKPDDPKAIKNGTIVAARVEGQTTLKYLQRVDEETIRLEPANSNFLPIDVNAEEINIQGVYVGSVRGLI